MYMYRSCTLEPWQQTYQTATAQQQQQQRCGGSVSIIVKQEQETGFLGAWNLQQQQQQQELHQQDQHQCDFDPNRCSPEEQKRYESQLIKEELNCKIQLKMIQEGKNLPTEVDDQQTAKYYQISEETRKLQKIRREKNREAAKKCRQKKKQTEKELEQKVREQEKHVAHMQQQLAESQQEFSHLLDGLHSFPCFIAYLRQNRQVLRQPALKALLQKFAKTHGCQVAPGQQCAVCPMMAVSAGGVESSVEQ